jgi:hypothetical protein
MTDPEAESMALTSEVTLPFSTMLSALRLLADRELTTVLGVFQPENRDASCCAVTIKLAIGICLKLGLFTVNT